MEILNSHYRTKRSLPCGGASSAICDPKSKKYVRVLTKKQLCLSFLCQTVICCSIIFNVIKLTKDINFLFELNSEIKKDLTKLVVSWRTVLTQIKWQTKFLKYIASQWNVAQLTELVWNITRFLWRLQYNRSLSAITVIMREYLHIYWTVITNANKREVCLHLCSTANTFYLSLKVNTCIISFSA